MTTIQVREQVDPCYATVDDAWRLSAQIKEALDAGDSVLAEFSGVERLDASFLGVAIGSLCEFYSLDDLEARVSCTGLDPTDERRLPYIKWKAARFFAAPLERREAYIAAQIRKAQEDDWDA